MLKKFLSILLLAIVVTCPSLSHAASFCPLTDIGAYKFMERLGYADYFSDDYQVYQGANLYSAVLPDSNLSQISKGNLLMFVYPDSGKLAQVSVIFNYNTYMMTNVEFATNIMKAIEGDAYVNDRSQVEAIMLQLFNSYDRQALLSLVSPSTGRKYGISREINMPNNAMILSIKAITID